MWTASLIAALGLAVPAAPPTATPQEISAPGPRGDLHGTLIPPAAGQPVILILPGSGPTDRDGNSPMGVRAASYRLLAEALAARGIGTARIDKRGIGGSAGAVADPSAITVADYAADTRRWITAVRERTGRDCVWIAGHSEGGLVALVTAQQPAGICGVILIAAPGRPIGAILRAQLRANPANAPLLEQGLGAIDRMEAGARVDTPGLHPALQGLFASQVQNYLIDLMRHDPAALAARLSVPLLIVQGDADLQVGTADAQRLHDARPGATMALLPGVNHVLKAASADDARANLATYGDPALPIAPAVTDAVAGFVGQSRN